MVSGVIFNIIIELIDDRSCKNNKIDIQLFNRTLNSKIHSQNPNTRAKNTKRITEVSIKLTDLLFTTIETEKDLSLTANGGGAK